MHKLSDFDYNGKKVLLRVDLNVPVVSGKILDDTRINKIIPTIKYLQNTGAKVIIASHFSRPKGMIVPEMSLEFLSSILSEKLGSEVLFCCESVGELAEKMANNIAANQVLLLENLRFYPGESKNDSAFAQQLAKLADFYINDAFSCSHRAHASIAKIKEFLPSAAGLLLTKELESLSRYLLQPTKPMMAIIGGSKVSTKLDLLNSLVTQVDYLVIGGAMANTFLKAQGYNIGNSFYEPELIKTAKVIARNTQIILPIDIVVAEKIAETQANKVLEIDAVADSEMILDIGPKTVAQINSLLLQCKTVVINGPLGVFECFPFSVGTVSVAREIARLTNLGQLISVAGGGDIVAALVKAGLFDQFTYVSTAGGAFLEWLEGKKLPGIF